MNIDNFVAQVGSIGLSSGNRYEVQVPTLSQTENMLCSSVQIPSPTFNMFTWKNLSPNMRFPHDVLFEPLSMEFLQLDNGQPFRKLNDWNRQVFEEGTMRLNDFNSYAQGRNITVKQLSKQGSVIEHAVFHNCYPMIVGPVQLSYDNKSAPKTFPVTFFYEYSSLH